MNKHKLILIVGSSGAGKTTLAEMLAKERDCAFLSEDDFIFTMNPKTMITRAPRKQDRVLGMKSLWASLQVYLRAGRSVVVEGALVVACRKGMTEKCVRIMRCRGRLIYV